MAVSGESKLQEEAPARYPTDMRDRLEFSRRTSCFFPGSRALNFEIHSSVDTDPREFLIFVESVNREDAGELELGKRWQPAGFGGKYIYLRSLSAHSWEAIARLRVEDPIEQLVWGILAWKPSALEKPIPEFDVRIHNDSAPKIDTRISEMYAVEEIGK